MADLLPQLEELQLCLPNDQQMQNPVENQNESHSQGYSSSQASANEQDLHSHLALSDLELQQLSSDQPAFFSKIQEFNDIAVEKIQATNYNEALVYLSEAERMLNFAALRGKTIERNLILCVLNNEAVAYQKLWVIEKTSKYIEALIYNLETSIEEDNVPGDLLYDMEMKSKEEIDLSLSVIKRKNLLIRYHLIYCALMSQDKCHSIAISSSFKALEISKDILRGLSGYYKSNAFKETEQRAYTPKKLKLLEELSSYNENLSVENYEMLFKRTQYVLKEWREAKAEIRLDDKIQLDIREYSIAKVMQTEPQTFSQFDSPINFLEEMSMRSLIHKVLLLAINFFSIATEIRLMDSLKHPSAEEKAKSCEFKRSDLYHLTAIKILCTYVPYDSILIKHIQSSYLNHYKHQISVEEVEYVPDDQFVDRKLQMSVVNASKDKELVMNIQESEEEDVHILPVNKVPKRKKKVPIIEIPIPKSPKVQPLKTQTPKTKVDVKKLLIKTKTPRNLGSPQPPSTRRPRDEPFKKTPNVKTVSTHKLLNTVRSAEKTKKSRSKSTHKPKLSKDKTQNKSKQKLSTKSRPHLTQPSEHFSPRRTPRHKNF